MARTVPGLGTSNSPLLSIPGEVWAQRGGEDRKSPWLYTVPDGRHVSYDDQAATAGPGLAKQLNPHVVGEGDVRLRAVLPFRGRHRVRHGPRPLAVAGPPRNRRQRGARPQAWRRTATW